MTFYEIAAVAFLSTLSVKFTLGAIGAWELDAIGELAINVAVGVLFFIFLPDLLLSTALLGSACGMMAHTVWSFIQIARVKMLFSLQNGLRR